MKLDKTSFKAKKASDSTNDRAYFLSLSPVERWEILDYLNLQAYQLDVYPKLDRTAFSKRKHEN